MPTQEADWLSKGRSRRHRWAATAEFIAAILRPLGWKTLATFAGIAGIAAAQTTVYLPAPNTAIMTIPLSTCTNTKPIVCTTSVAHGLSNGAAVWIQGIAVNG